MLLCSKGNLWRFKNPIDLKSAAWSESLLLHFNFNHLIDPCEETVVGQLLLPTELLLPLRVVHYRDTKAV